MSSAKTVWMKVRQLTGRSKNQANNCHSDLSADKLNDHYATISTDANYAAPGIKCTCSSSDAFDPISEWRIFNIFDVLCHTSTGLDNIPA